MRLIDLYWLPAGLLSTCSQQHLELLVTVVDHPSYFAGLLVFANGMLTLYLA
jgi:hypothetical protein